VLDWMSWGMNYESALYVCDIPSSVGREWLEQTYRFSRAVKAYPQRNGKEGLSEIAQKRGFI
jgi:uncharacterized hydantoinase/oxoprolinase family protein